MSKGLTFFLGIITGAVLTIIILAIIAATLKDDSSGLGQTVKGNNLPDGVTLLEEPIAFTEANNFKVMQVIFNDSALAQSEAEIYGLDSIFSDPIVLIVADQQNTFYDGQIVKCPNNSQVMQVGTYKYQTRLGWKTVPIVKFIKRR